MIYSLSSEEVDKIRNTPLLPHFPDAEMLLVTFESDPDFIGKVLPSPLRPAGDNTASAFVARYPRTNFGCIYNEGAVFLHCRHKGDRGMYCLSMPVDDDMAMIGGRETYGYPKKIADKITLEKHGNTVIGSVVRKGTEIIRIDFEVSGKAPENPFGAQGVMTTDWDGEPCIRIVSFLFKHFTSPAGDKFDYIPRLVREPVLFRAAGETRSGNGTLTLGSTKFEPLGEVPVKRVLDMTYGRFNNTMLPGKVVSRTWNIPKYLKHAFFKIDMAHSMMERYDPGLASERKEIYKKAKRY